MNKQMIEGSRAKDQRLIVVIDEFAVNPEGRWVTTGKYWKFKAECREHAQAIADLHGGTGRSIYVGNHEEEAESDLHQRVIVWQD